MNVDHIYGYPEKRAKYEKMKLDINIDMHKDDSHLLSYIGLKYYYDYDRMIFEKIKNRFLSDRWRNNEFQLQIKEIAHNIRNRMTNLKLKQIKLYPPDQMQLSSNI